MGGQINGVRMPYQLAKERLSISQKITYLVGSQDFRDFFCQLEERLQKFTFVLIHTQDLEGLRKLFYEKTTGFVEQKTLKELRDIAFNLGIERYTKLSKEELLIEITQVTHAIRPEKVTRGVPSEQESDDQNVRASKS